jgi:hypothetical protein
VPGDAALWGIRSTTSVSDSRTLGDLSTREFRKKAIEEGLPYQTLISSVLHKYINGRLVEKAS